MVNTASGTAVTYATYGYDAIGRETSENLGSPTLNKYLQYDVTGRVTMVARDATFTQPVVKYLYDETGKKIEKMSYNSSYQLVQVTYYYGDAIYTQTVTGGVYGALTAQEYQLDGGSGRLGVFYKQSSIYAYQLTDHLGNVRAVVALNAGTCQVRMYNDYYPYGMVISSGGTNDYRYDYQGTNSEKDGETGWNNFELRMYNSRIARWFTTDPQDQYYSPYEAMGNDPASSVDPDGGSTDNFFKNLQTGAIFWADDVENYADRSIYQDLGTHYTDGDFEIFGFYGLPNGGITGIYRDAKWRESDIEDWKKAYIAHDVFNRDHPWAPGQGNYLRGTNPSNFQWVWHEALEAPAIDPIDIVAGGIPAIFKEGAEMLAAKGGVQYTKSSLQLGQQMHKAYKVGDVVEGVAMKEFRGIPGIRPDFVDFSTKTIYELKPFNPRAMQQGWNQLNKYQNLFQQKYGGTWKTVLDTY